MSINNATASDWDRLRKQLPAIEVSKPTIDESMMKVYLDAAEEEQTPSIVHAVVKALQREPKMMRRRCCQQP